MPATEDHTPCFSGDTLVATADGRGCVSLRELAELDEDVLVYSIDQLTQQISVLWGRHPRITGTDKELLRIYLDPAAPRATDPGAAHKVTVPVALHPSSPASKSRKRRSDRKRTPTRHATGTDTAMATAHGSNHEEEYVDVTPDHMFVTNDNNTVRAKNLRPGDSLPAYTQAHRPGRGTGHGHNGGSGCTGTASSVYDNGSQVYRTRDQLLGVPLHPPPGDASETPVSAGSPSEALAKMHHQSRRWVLDHLHELHAHAEAIGLRLEYDERTHTLHILRKCEQCSHTFRAAWIRRERCFCSPECVKAHKFANDGRKREYRASLHGKMKTTFHRQVAIYQRFRDHSIHAGGRGVVSKRQWEQQCASEGIHYLFNRLADNKPWTASSWTEFKDICASYGRRVKRVEKLADVHTVYNITVDHNHTVAVVTRRGAAAMHLTGLYTFQCGEGA